MNLFKLIDVHERARMLARSLPAPASASESLEALAEMIADRTAVKLANHAHQGEILNCEQAASLLHLHPETVRQWCRKGKIPATQLGGSQGNWQISKAIVTQLVSEGASSKSLQMRKRVAQRMGI